MESSIISEGDLAKYACVCPDGAEQLIVAGYKAGIWVAARKVRLV